MPHASLQQCDFKSAAAATAFVYVAAFICYCREHKPKKSIYSINATPYQMFGDKFLHKSGEEKRRHGWSLNGQSVRGPAWTRHKNETFSFGWILQCAGGKHLIPDNSCKVSLWCNSDSLTHPLRLLIHTYNGRLCSNKVVFFFHFTIVFSDSKKRNTPLEISTGLWTI